MSALDLYPGEKESDALWQQVHKGLIMHASHFDYVAKVCVDNISRRFYFQVLLNDPFGMFARHL